MAELHLFSDDDVPRECGHAGQLEEEQQGSEAAMDEEEGEEEAATHEEEGEKEAAEEEGEEEEEVLEVVGGQVAVDQAMPEVRRNAEMEGGEGPGRGRAGAMTGVEDGRAAPLAREPWRQVPRADGAGRARASCRQKRGGRGGRGQRRGELAEPQVQEERTSMASHGTSQQQQGRRVRPPAAAGEEAPAQHPQPADVGGDGSRADGAGGDGSLQGEAAGGDPTVYLTQKQLEEQYKGKWTPKNSKTRGIRIFRRSPACHAARDRRALGIQALPQEGALGGGARATGIPRVQRL